MNDFRSILNFREWVYKENLASVDYLEDTVCENDIVVTHHLPSNKCVHANYKDSELNRFFVCDITRLIEKNSPKLFISGHTHKSYDFLINSTSMICNPLGYPNENNKNEFDWNKIFDL